MSGRFSYIHHRHKLCTNELGRIFKNVPPFFKASEKHMDFIQDNWEHICSDTAAMDECNRYVKRCNAISLLCGQLDELLCTSFFDDSTIDCELKNLQIKCHPKAGNVPMIARQNAHSVPLSNLSLAPAEYPSYSMKDLSIYKPGDTITALVIRLDQAESLHFYMCDINDNQTILVLQPKEQMIVRSSMELPGENEIFGLLDKGYVLRAIRLSASNKRVFLLDFGEVLLIDEHRVIYDLPDSLKNAPSQAMPARLMGILNNPVISVDVLGQRLIKLQYEVATFHVHGVADGLLTVLLVDELPQESITPSMEPLLPSMEPEPTATTESTNPFLTKAVHQNSEILNSEYLEEIEPLPCFNREIFEVVDESHKGFSAEDVEMLREEPPCTSNALKAVLGHEPQDEKRICRFYDPKTKACFKGAGCKLDHEPLHQDGWTKDVVPASFVAPECALPRRYDTGAIISITPTYVEHLLGFYAQINDPTAPITPLLWSNELIPRWNRLKKLPDPFDLILGQYEDGFWYRAKVLSVDDNSKSALLFFVDYGNRQIVHKRGLAKCDPTIAQLPFQARHFLFAAGEGVRLSNTSQRSKAVASLRARILNGTFNVEITDQIGDDILTRFIDL